MTWWQQAYDVSWDVIDRFIRNDGSAVAGYIAFSGFLAIFPFLIFATSLIALLVGEGRSEEVVEALFQLAPEHVALTLEPVLAEVLSQRSGGVLTVALLAAIWIASNAIEALRMALDRAYGVYVPMPVVTNRLKAIAFVFLGACVAFILGFLILLSPLIIRLLQTYAMIQIPNFAQVISYALGVAVFVAYLRAMHRWLPGRRMRQDLLWPGVLLTTVLWMAGAGGFSIYLSYTPTYTITYGAMAGVIITLMFLYLTGVAIIIGAEANAALNALRNRRLYAD